LCHVIRISCEGQEETQKAQAKRIRSMRKISKRKKVKRGRGRHIYSDEEEDSDSILEDEEEVLQLSDDEECDKENMLPLAIECEDFLSSRRITRL
jgi:hypothetical protein